MCLVIYAMLDRNSVRGYVMHWYVQLAQDSCRFMNIFIK